jgi:hypothetical protein
MAVVCLGAGWAAALAAPNTTSAPAATAETTKGFPDPNRTVESSVTSGLVTSGRAQRLPILHERR